MRLMLDLVIGINAMAGIVGLMIRHFRRNRRHPELTHLEYQEKLRRQNQELDEERERMGLH